MKPQMLCFFVASFGGRSPPGLGRHLLSLYEQAKDNKLSSDDSLLCASYDVLSFTGQSLVPSSRTHTKQC